MKIDVQLSYYEHGVIPPRCRKPRTVSRTVAISVEIAETTADGAPVAFIEPSWDERPPVSLRWHNEKLWAPHLPWSGQTEPSLPGSEHFPSEQDVRVPYSLDGYDSAVRYVRSDVAEAYLIIDGVVWELTGEPRYVIYTLGLGHNHSSTGLGVDRHYNSNIHRSRYFRADQFEQAKTEAVRLAIQRGDTNSVRMINEERPIQVLIPDAVRCYPAQEAGDGDPFINQMHGLTASAGSADAACALLFGLSLIDQREGIS